MNAGEWNWKWKGAFGQMPFCQFVDHSDARAWMDEDALSQTPRDNGENVFSSKRNRWTDYASSPPSHEPFHNTSQKEFMVTCSCEV